MSVHSCWKIIRLYYYLSCCLCKMWVFGYGSLMWKVDFPIEDQKVGFIQGYNRRFFQHSTDHRGTPDQPGRVVTLIPGEENARVYGVAYKIRECEVEEVVKHLDYREKGGYVRTPVNFYPIEGEPFGIVIYLANSDNPQFAGPADLDSIAMQIVTCSGPSGPNRDYVLNLARTMRELFPNVQDEHLFELEKRVLALI